MTPPTATDEFVFVDRPDQLALAVEAIRRAPMVGLDTEFIGETTYEPDLCLIQIATRDQIFLIDPLARIDLRDFWSALTRPDLELVAFAAREELLFCLRYAQRLPGIVFDPQLAAGLVGFSYPLSHTRVVELVLDVRLEAGETNTDWRQRPLSRRQMVYAAEDVAHLLDLRDALVKRAEGMGRLEWVVDECDRLTKRVADYKRVERWSRIGGASRLKRRELAVLREIWMWRDNTARNANLTPRRVMSDDLMVEIAKRSPKNSADLFALRGMDRPALRQAGSQIVAAVGVGLNLPDAELPVLGRRDPPQVSILSSLAAILTNSLAAEHQVDSSMLATMSDLQDFVRWRLGIGDEGSPAIMDGWRGEILGTPLVELLEGKRSLRVADLRSASPLIIERL